MGFEPPRTLSEVLQRAADETGQVVSLYWNAEHGKWPGPGVPGFFAGDEGEAFNTMAHTDGMSEAVAAWVQRHGLYLDVPVGDGLEDICRQAATRTEEVLHIYCYPSGRTGRGVNFHAGETDLTLKRPVAGAWGRTGDYALRGLLQALGE